MGAAIAPSIRLRLPSCHPGFKSQARFYLLKLNLRYICQLNKRKRGWVWLIKTEQRKSHKLDGLHPIFLRHH